MLNINGAAKISGFYINILNVYNWLFPGRAKLEIYILIGSSPIDY